jgi:hypothetical protein
MENLTPTGENSGSDSRLNGFGFGDDIHSQTNKGLCNQSFYQLERPVISHGRDAGI